MRQLTDGEVEEGAHVHREMQCDGWHDTSNLVKFTSVLRHVTKTLSIFWCREENSMDTQSWFGMARFFGLPETSETPEGRSATFRVQGSSFFDVFLASIAARFHATFLEKAFF